MLRLSILSPSQSEVRVLLAATGTRETISRQWCDESRTSSTLKLDRSRGVAAVLLPVAVVHLVLIKLLVTRSALRSLTLF